MAITSWLSYRNVIIVRVDGEMRASECAYEDLHGDCQERTYDPQAARHFVHFKVFRAGRPYASTTTPIGNDALAASLRPRSPHDAALSARSIASE